MKHEALNLAARGVPDFMRAMLGEDTFRDVESLVVTLSGLELRGAISAEWHNQIINEIADEIIAQQIANDIGEESLTDEAACPDTPTPCGHSNCDSSTR